MQVANTWLCNEIMNSHPPVQIPSSLQSIVSIFEVTTACLGLLAQVCAVVGATSAALYFWYRRRPLATWVTSQQKANRLERRIPKLEVAAIRFGLASGVLALLGSFAGVTYVVVNKKLRSFEERQRLALEARVATANARAEEAILKQKELEERNLKLSARLERERRERVQLEDALYSERAFDSELAIKRFAPFVGTRVIIEWKATEEATSLATQIAYALQEAKWGLVISEKPGLTSEVPLQTGVLGILVRCSSGNTFNDNSNVPNSCAGSVASAADALVREMEENGLRVWRDFRLPTPNSIKVMVGEKEKRLEERRERRIEDRREKRRKSTSG